MTNKNTPEQRKQKLETLLKEASLIDADLKIQLGFNALQKEEYAQFAKDIYLHLKLAAEAINDNDKNSASSHFKTMFDRFKNKHSMLADILDLGNFSEYDNRVIYFTNRMGNPRQCTVKDLLQPIISNLSDKQQNEFGDAFNLLPFEITEKEKQFLKNDIGEISLQNLPIDPEVIKIIANRMIEIEKCLSGSCFLAAVVLMGSVAEAMFLDAAKKFPDLFRKSQKSPKRQSKVKEFNKWTLNEFIMVAYDQKLITCDTNTFSHHLREFRNYIHPEKQLNKDDIHEGIAKICEGVLNCIIRDLKNYIQSNTAT